MFRPTNRFLLFILISTMSTFTMQQLAMERKKAISLEEIYSHAQKLANRIKEKSEELKTILSDYQTYDVTAYEIERCLRTLAGLHNNSEYLSSGKQIDSAAVMLPSNLPLYSLLTFALIPSVLCNHIYVRPNSILQKNDIIPRICAAINSDNLFPVSIENTDHAGFRQFIKDANLIVFTGKPINAEPMIKDMKVGAVLALNGAGHNPVVVTESANIDKAVEGTVYLKGFNGGQDCAGPDAILIHCNVAEQFIEKFQKKYSSLKTGQFKEPDTIIGPISRFSELQRFADTFRCNKNDILAGGSIDYKNNIVSPTTIVRSIKNNPNYKEMFGPVAFIHPYETDEDLAYYFQDENGQYHSNRMYVSVYGHSEYVDQRDDNTDSNRPGNIGIALRDQTIHDVEIGYDPFGGYSLAGSSVIKKTDKGIQKKAMPILIPEVISEYLLKNKTVSEDDSQLSLTPQNQPRKQKVKILKEVASKIFRTNLAFGFTYVETAQEQSNSEIVNILRSFICLHHDDQKMQEEYARLNVDYPAQIMSLQALKKLADLFKNKPFISVVKENLLEQLLWIQALSYKKIEFLGDNKQMSTLKQKCYPIVGKWRTQILEQSKTKPALHQYLCQTFPDLPEDEVIKKLSVHDHPNITVNLGLKYYKQSQ